MNAPTPWDVAPPADYPLRNVVPLHRGYVRPIDAHRTASTLNDAEMIAAIERRLRETRHITIGDPDTAYANAIHEMIGEWVFLALGVVAAVLWIAAFFIAGREGWF